MLLVVEHYTSQNRTASLQRLAPDLFTNQHKTVLYIGARNGGFEYGKEFREAGMDITVLEAYKENADYLKTILPKVIHGDIRYKEINEKFDVVFWWHGPEHIIEEELPQTIKKLESIANHMVVLGNPWGKYKQDPIYGNPYEEHISHTDFPFFENLGYTVECLGVKDVPGSNITSVKRMV